VQKGFKAWLPGLFDYYLLLADAGSFSPRRGVGAALERTVIRWLYGRPLETLAGHLGHQPRADAGGALALRRAERAGGKPGLAVGRLGTC
jgi:hypothetical protein